MSSYRIGMNLRVTEDSNQGGRRYMEDRHAIRFVKNEEGGFEFAYFGIFDGHGGGEASKYARDYLLDEITKYDCFWSDNDEDILYAIKSAFLDTHYGMWKELDKWPRTGSGLPSTAGTTASIAIIKNSKLYVGHVGDSAIVLGKKYPKSSYDPIGRSATMLTKDHKPDDPAELQRIELSGGQVVAKSGVQRVVWNRPRTDHKGPVRRSTPIDKIPFLAVARSLGDLWSYNYLKEEFVVSPEPDVSVHKLNPEFDKCLVIGSDGLWNMLSADESVNTVFDLESQFEHKVINDPTVPLSYWINPAERLVQAALAKWRMRLMKADNTSAIVVLIDPLGPRKLSILRKKREERMKEIAEKRINNAKAAELLTAQETLTIGSPKKVPVKDELVPVISYTVKGKGGISEGRHSAPAQSPVNKFLDDSIQLLNDSEASQLNSSKHNEAKHSKSATMKTTSPSVQSPVTKEDTSPTRMATRQSPHKSVSPSPSPVTHKKLQKESHVSTIGKSRTQAGPSSEQNISSSLSNSNQQKCLQPSKCTSDNVKPSIPSKQPTVIKMKGLENMYSSVVQFSKGHLNLRTNLQKCKDVKNLNNSSSVDAVRTAKKVHSSKSLTTRISLRLRRLRQKTQTKRSHLENKGFVKPGTKRKLDSESSSVTPASKKAKHS